MAGFSGSTLGAVKSWTEEYVQGVIGSTGIKVGTIDQNSTGFPTTRPDGSPLHKEDYVTVSGSALLPFTLDGKTFSNKLDRGVWSGSVWGFSAGSVVESDEVSISEKGTESISGTATTQSAVNKEIKEEFAKVKESSSATSNSNKSADDCVFSFEKNIGTAMVDTKLYVNVYITNGLQTKHGHLQTIEHYKSQTVNITQTFYCRESNDIDNEDLDIYVRKGVISSCLYNQIYNNREQINWTSWKKVNETIGLAVSDKTNESISGNAESQSDINKEIKTKFTDINSLINELEEEYKKAGFTFSATQTDLNGLTTITLNVKDKQGNNLLSKDLTSFVIGSRTVAGYELNDDITANEILDAIKDLPAELTNKIIDCGTFN